MRRIVYAAEKRILMKVVPKKSAWSWLAIHIEGGNVLMLYVLAFKLSVLVLEITVINTGRNEIKTPVIYTYSNVQKSWQTCNY